MLLTRKVHQANVKKSYGRDRRRAIRESKSRPGNSLCSSCSLLIPHIWILIVSKVLLHIYSIKLHSSCFKRENQSEIIALHVSRGAGSMQLRPLIMPLLLIWRARLFGGVELPHVCTSLDETGFAERSHRHRLYCVAHGCISCWCRPLIRQAVPISL